METTEGICTEVPRPPISNKYTEMTQAAQDRTWSISVAENAMHQTRAPIVMPAVTPPPPPPPQEAKPNIASFAYVDE